VAARWCSTSTTGPNLWGLAGHDAGDNRYIASRKKCRRGSEELSLPGCDLIVGTEEEVLIASGESELLAALKMIRALIRRRRSCLKRGPMGCIVYEGAISDDLEDGIVGKGFPIEVYNVLGAGDAFMSGFLRGWLGGEPPRDGGHLGECLRRLRRVAPALRAGKPDLRPSCSILPRSRAARIEGAAQGRGDQPHPLGDDAAPRHPGS
jgi:sugar/nucleoside kinase (ribokinase family)